LSRAAKAGPWPKFRPYRGLWFIGPLALIGAVLFEGCQRRPAAQQTPVRSQAAQGQLSVKLLDSVSEMLNRLDFADPEQGMQQIVERLNQWAGGQEPPAWQPDPLAVQLAAQLPAVPGADQLAKLQFDRSDAVALREALWLKRIADRAGKDTDLKMSARLFDWTIRNIQLVADESPEGFLDLLPEDIVLLGRGTAVDRAWIFILLARQAGLDGAMLSVAGDGTQAGQLWLPAIWIDNAWYLFDARLGLPIPGPNGEGVATLEQVRSDDSLLRQLDLPDGAGEYPIKSADLDNVTALLVASPSALSRRMQLVEAKLPGTQKLVLSTRPTQFAQDIRAAKSPINTALWSLPFERLLKRKRLSDREKQALVAERAHIDYFQAASQVGSARRRRPEDEDDQSDQRHVQIVFPLRTGRPLHLRGEFDGDEGAKHFYMLARPSAREISSFKLPVERFVSDRAKQDATYWLGLIAIEQGKEPSVVVDLLLHKTLEAFPDGRWTPGARFNLARVYEDAGQSDRAIELYEADDSPQRAGNLLRARKLKSQAGHSADAAADE
jgi:hypothetical protein